MIKAFLLRFCIPVLMLSALSVACKKEEDEFKIRGKISNTDGAPVPGALVKIQKQSVNGGVYTSNYTTAVSGSSDSNGQYDLTFKRENFSSLRLNVEAENYITHNSLLDLDRFSPGDYVDQSVTLQKEAFLTISIQNTGQAANSDNFNFTFTNANFDCVCCSNGWKYFNGSNIDTSFTCRVYGDSWVKFSRYIQTSEQDTTINDSIYCPAIQTTQVLIQY